MAKKIVKHYQKANNYFMSYCGRASLYVGDLPKKNSTFFKRNVTCKHCIQQMKKDGIIKEAHHGQKKEL